MKMFKDPLEIVPLGHIVSIITFQTTRQGRLEFPSHFLEFTGIKDDLSGK
jgi:hypothetical protein